MILKSEKQLDGQSLAWRTSPWDSLARDLCPVRLQLLSHQLPILQVMQIYGWRLQAWAWRRGAALPQDKDRRTFSFCERRCYDQSACYRTACSAQVLARYGLARPYTALHGSAKTGPAWYSLQPEFNKYPFKLLCVPPFSGVLLPLLLLLRQCSLHDALLACMLSVGVTLALDAGICSRV